VGLSRTNSGISIRICRGCIAGQRKDANASSLKLQPNWESNKVKKWSILAKFSACSIAFVIGNAAQAECVTDIHGNTLCPPADARCVSDRYGQWHCSSAGGDAMLNINGDPICGVGHCVTDINLRIMCSTEPRGSAALDLARQAVCSGGCTQALAGQCRALSK
jgi:hypothetical protein